jgi:predicted anti-sigma-YlaC factor YlaD
MIGVALALIVAGVVLLFIIPWVGIAAGIVGLILALLYAAGFGRRAAEPTP